MTSEHAPGLPIFKVKPATAELVPKCPQIYQTEDRELGKTKPWTVVREHERYRLEDMVKQARWSEWFFDEVKVRNDLRNMISEFVGEGHFTSEARSRAVPRMLADIIVHNGGALVTGGPGTGKTVLELEIISEWKRRYPKQRIITMAQTHMASRLMPGGMTLAHVLNKEIHGKIAGALVIVDEASMVGLGAWSVLAEWKLLGCVFVVLGDFEGQFLPIADTYGADIRVDRLDIMRQIANSLHVVLTVPKRFEQAHFDWVMSKYPLADSPFVPAHAEEVRGRFPYRGEEIDLYITICHRHRRMLNALANQRDRAGVLVKCAPASGANLPQDMYLRVGMTLLGCTKNSGLIVNGVPYTVVAVTATYVKVQMLPAYKRDLSLSFKTGKAKEREEIAVAKLECELVLSHRQASQKLRLPYAVTYRNSQGITARDKRVMITSLNMPQFDVRSLIVGSSRVTRGNLLFAPTRAQETQLLQSCPEVADPPESIVGEPVDTDAEDDDE